MAATVVAVNRLHKVGVTSVQNLTFSTVMFQVKLSTALCSFLPFSPSFTAKSWRFSWNSIAARKRQMRMSQTFCGGL